jgi:hypothetical protein
MRLNKILLSGLTAMACLSLAPDALADGRNPGSLLLYPEFDNRYSDLTLVTVTNTNPDVTNGTIDVEFVYIGRYDREHNPINCLEFNRTHRLTANDTLTLITSHHNPQQEQGFLYVFAKDPNNGRARAFDWLSGNLMAIRGIDTIEYSMNPVAFKGIGDGEYTDVDGDSVRDLDGVEYEQITDEVLIPRFLAVGDGFKSELILLGLSGGSSFETIVNFLVYNDNEEVFSAQRQFRCWERVKLEYISGVFDNYFLKSTNHAYNEIIGASSREAGWMRLDGATAFSTAEQIIDPAIYAVLVERVRSGGVTFGAADLPFENGLQSNGDLYPIGPFGDGGVNGDNQ